MKSVSFVTYDVRAAVALLASYGGILLLARSKWSSLDTLQCQDLYDDFHRRRPVKIIVPSGMVMGRHSRSPVVVRTRNREGASVHWRIVVERLLRDHLSDDVLEKSSWNPAPLWVATPLTRWSYGRAPVLRHPAFEFQFCIHRRARAR